MNLPVAASDPAESYGRGGRGPQFRTQHEGSSFLLDLGNHMAVLHSFVARSLFATRLFNVTVTNVPWTAGSSLLLRLADRGDLAGSHAIGLAVFSYDGTLYFLPQRVDCDSCGRTPHARNRELHRELRELAAAAATA